MINTFLCDELDTSALRLAYAKWRGESVDPPQFKLAISNLLSYGVYLTPDAVFGSRSAKAAVPPVNEASDDEVEEAFESLLELKANDPASMRSIGDGTFLKLIMPVLLKLLTSFLV